MKYLVSWSLPHGTFSAAASQFLETGGAPPSGVELIGRWHGMSGQGFAVVESGDPKALYKFQAQWAHLLPLIITPCLEDADAGEVLAGLARK